jgi:hypothetical protein
LLCKNRPDKGLFLLPINGSRRTKLRDFALKEGEKIKYFEKGQVFFLKCCTFGKIYGIMVEKNNDFPFL